MLQALLVTFREGIESFLIVGVVSSYLQKTGRASLVRGVRWGVALSLLTCLGGAWLWLQVPNQPEYEGVAALATALFVAPLLWQAVRAGKGIKAAIESRVEAATTERVGASAWPAAIGVALATALLVTREGLEAVFYLGVQVMASRAAASSRAWLVVAGAAMGLALAAVVSLGWARLSRRLDLAVVLKVSAVFLALFLIQVVVYGIHELAESGIIQGSQAFHDATEIFGPDGAVGHFISYSLLGAPLVYLAWVRRKRAAVAT